MHGKLIKTKILIWASNTKNLKSIKEKMFWLAKESRSKLNNNLYPSKMYDYIKGLYDSGIKWEQTRDSIYFRYQVLSLIHI